MGEGGPPTDERCDAGPAGEGESLANTVKSHQATHNFRELYT
jgi:hypothetical protein